MSHTVTVTRTTTTTSTSAILLNVGYFRTIPGILKILHVVLGVVVVGIIGYHIKPVLTYDRSSIAAPLSQLFTPELFFLLMAVTCLVTSTLLLISCLISIATATILPKTVFELVYHCAAFLLILVASITYIIQIQASSFRQAGYTLNYIPGYKWRIAASVVGMVNAILYGIAAFFSWRNFRIG